MKQKVIVVYKDLENSISEEYLWTETIGNGLYRIDNIPFFAPNLALNDIISVEEEDGKLYFDDLIEPSGHSTIQLILLKKSNAQIIIREIESFGCKWESINNKPYYSLDIPPNTKQEEVIFFLNTQTEKGILDYKEACLAENHY